MNALKQIASTIDRINGWIGLGAAWSVFIAVIVVFADIAMRHVFEAENDAARQLEYNLCAFVFLMGAGATLLKDGHIRVDIVHLKPSPATRAWIDLAGVVFFLLPGCVAIILVSRGIFEVPSPGGFIPKVCVPVGFALLALQGVSLGIKSFLTILGHDAEEDAYHF